MSWKRAGKLALFGIIPTVILSVVEIYFLVGFVQYVTDRAYNKGRVMEQVCAKSIREHTALDCSRHYLDTGHSIRPSLYE